MISKYLLPAFFLLLVCLSAEAQNNPWKNKKCAVALTYDDALNVHIDQVAPALDSISMKGTFYLSGYFPGCKDRLADWKKVASRGHELANHTLFHPCTKTADRGWVKLEYDLASYSPARIADEIRM